MNPQIKHLGKMSIFLRVSIHIYGVSKEDRWENVHFLSNPRHVTPQINQFRKMSIVLRVSIHIYGVSQDIDGKMFIL